MEFLQKNLKFSIRPAYLRQSIERKEFENFCNQLLTLFDKIIKDETEENHKNYLRDFLKNTFYADYDINTRGRIDLVIYSGKKAKESQPVVLLEVKRSQNKVEMPTTNDLNRKALHELIHYFLHERLIEKNYSLKYLVITDIYHWFVFDARDFESAFVKDFGKVYLDWARKRQSAQDTQAIYDQIKRFVEQSGGQMPYTYFDLEQYLELCKKQPENTDLIDLFKFFSPTHLLKLPFANDNNQLDRKFYSELLYILGLEEQKDRTITRVPVQRRRDGALIEETIYQIKHVQPGLDDQQAFEIALSLVLTWINRILFLKLLENQLVLYNGKKEFAFVNKHVINDFDDLNTLFFSVLAEKPQDRRPRYQKKFYFVPFLNSSLFEMTRQEHDFILISNLDDSITLPVYGSTVLVDPHTGKSIAGKEMKTLHYLLDFLGAYDFGAEGQAQIVDRRRNLINAAVLGLIFERINGYKDGSFFTPGAITQFIAQKTIEPVILQRFSQYFDRSFKTIDGLKNYIRANVYEPGDLQRASDFFDTIRIVDPAVGSGHFLVSALNQLVAYKGQLGLILDKNSEPIYDWKFSVENDDLVVRNRRTGEFFQYRVKDFEPIPELQKVQVAIFHTKQKIIENSLFGVDINHNSAKITRLRLWIELLKNMYYLDGEPKVDAVPPMQVLPNIDINIKTGDALVSRFDPWDDINSLPLGYRQKVKQAIDKLRQKVALYKATSDKRAKKQFEKEIAIIIKQLSQSFDPRDKDYQKLKLLRAKLGELTAKLTFDPDEKKAFDLQAKLLAKQIEQLEQRLAQKYQNSFEWRFQFPEVLDANGNFMGFDIVVGNPPYIQLQKNSGKLAERYKDLGYKTFDRMGDIYALFYERGFQILRPNGWLGYITSNKWMRAGYGKKLRKFLSNFQIHYLIDLGPDVFEAATVDTNILIASKEKPYKPTRALTLTKDKDLLTLKEQDYTLISGWNDDSWIIISSAERRIKDKIEQAGVPLKNWDIKIYYGIKTGYNPAFIIDGKVRQQLIEQDPRSQEIIKPLLRGRDIKRYYAQFADKWLINVHNGILVDSKTRGYLRKKYKNKPFLEITDDFGIKINVPEAFIIPPVNINDYPVIKKWLNQFWNKLVKRYDQGYTPYNLRNCDYLQEFEKEKIVWKRIGSIIRFSYSDSSIFTLDSTVMATGEKLKYLVALLNSKLHIKTLIDNSPKTGTGDVIISVQALSPHKVYYPSNDEMRPFEQLVDEIIEMKKQGHQDTEELEREIDQMVYDLYGLTSEERAIVEKSIFSKI